MIKRIVEIGEGCYLHVENGQLRIDRDGIVTGTVPLEDLGILNIHHPGVTISAATLAGCMYYGVTVLFCDSHRLPVGAVHPLAGNDLHAKVLHGQVSASVPKRKALWQQVVQRKIIAQATLLERLDRPTTDLRTMATRVRSGDPDNIEAQAARAYWPILFGKGFRRTPGSDEPINRFLDYGYAVIRAATARAVTGAGMHPALGIHHHNEYDAFALADDLMEPYRPLVDTILITTPILSENNGHLTHEAKKRLIEVLDTPCTIGKVAVPLESALHYHAASVRDYLCGERERVEFPQP